MGCHWKQCHCKRGDLYSLYQTGLILRIGVVFLDRWTHFWTSALLRVLRSQLSAELFSPVCPFINYWGRFSNKTSTRNKLHNLVKIQHTHTHFGFRRNCSENLMSYMFIQHRFSKPRIVRRPWDASLSSPLSHWLAIAQQNLTHSLAHWRIICSFWPRNFKMLKNSDRPSHL